MRAEWEILEDLAATTTCIIAVFIAMWGYFGLAENPCKSAAAIDAAVILFFAYSGKLSDAGVEFIW